MAWSGVDSCRRCGSRSPTRCSHRGHGGLLPTVVARAAGPAGLPATGARRVLRGAVPGAGRRVRDPAGRPAGADRRHQRPDQLQFFFGLDLYDPATSGSSTSSWWACWACLPGRLRQLVRSRSGSCWWRCATARTGSASSATTRRSSRPSRSRCRPPWPASAGALFVTGGRLDQPGQPGRGRRRIELLIGGGHRRAVLAGRRGRRRAAVQLRAHRSSASSGRTAGSTCRARCSSR